MTSDAELVARSKNGEIEAFGVLVERYQRSVTASALAELRDIHSAEDIAQSAFLLAFRGIGTLRDGTRFGGWLMQIARRQIVDSLRVRKVPNLCAATESLDPGGNSVPSWEAHEHLLNHVARLPDHERILIGLRYFDGHSIAEMAESTGRPVGTVTKQLSRATARLRGWLQGDKS